MRIPIHDYQMEDSSLSCCDTATSNLTILDPVTYILVEVINFEYCLSLQTHRVV